MNRPILTDMASASKQGASQHCNLGGCLAWCQGLQLCVHFALCDVVSVISDDCVSEGKMQGNFGGTGAPGSPAYQHLLLLSYHRCKPGLHF